MSDLILKVENIETYYGKVAALKGVSFEMRAGQIVTLLGSNGAGKTTTLRTVSGLLPPAAGKISFMGEDITKMPSHEIVKRGLIHLPEGRRIFKDLTVTENLELGSFSLKDGVERKRRMEGVFDRFPILGQRRGQMGGTLSGGEQQMLAIGRALMAEPRLLLLDEPSLGLAPLLVKSIFHTIQSINEAGVTVILVEQNARAALKLAGRAYVLEVGRLVLEGKAADLLDNPKVQNTYLGGTD